jgi:hypothetical protein
MFSNFFFSPENRAVYEIVWKNTVKPDGPQMTVWRMRISLGVPEVTNITCRNTYNTNCFYTATMVVRTRLNVT